MYKCKILKFGELGMELVKEETGFNSEYEANQWGRLFINDLTNHDWQVEKE